eukprot:NODE_258_length_11607_cov_1.052659.p3 type:complete len:557 gc:universal NODE_258_length_11607_cov_1.052659:994-2664(+)
MELQYKFLKNDTESEIYSLYFENIPKGYEFLIKIIERHDNLKPYAKNGIGFFKSAKIDVANELVKGKLINVNMVFVHLPQMLLMDALPPLTINNLSTTKPKSKSSYANIFFKIQLSDFKILYQYEKHNLHDIIWNWDQLYCHSAIDLTTIVFDVMKACIKMGNLDHVLQLRLGQYFPASSLYSNYQKPVDICIQKRISLEIIGVCDVKIPHPKKSLNDLTHYEILDYMIDLRNSYHVRFPYGIFTTYYEWRIFWFEDSDIPSKLTDKYAFDEYCENTKDSQCGIEGNIKVYMSRIYRYDESDLIELLVSLMYKVSQTPTSIPNRLAQIQLKYVHVSSNSLEFKSLPTNFIKNETPFSYDMPSARCTQFYILNWNHRGGDGTVAICCSPNGNLGVLKFFHNFENENEIINERDRWNLLWATNCRIVKANNKTALLMPFAIHIRTIENQHIFCGLNFWNSRQVESPQFLESEMCIKIGMEILKNYQAEPLEVFKSAYQEMLNANIVHDDIKWSHVALLPVKIRSGYKLKPILIDLTRTRPLTDPKEIEMERALKELDE